MKLTTSVLLCLVAIFISLPSGAQKPSIEHGPWITNVTETGFTVVWTTAEKTFTWLELAPDKRWKGPRTDRFLSLSLFIPLLNEASTVQEPLDVGQTVAFLAADG